MFTMYCWKYSERGSTLSKLTKGVKYVQMTFVITVETNDSTQESIREPKANKKKLQNEVKYKEIMSLLLFCSFCLNFLLGKQSTHTRNSNMMFTSK